MKLCSMVSNARYAFISLCAAKKQQKKCFEPWSRKPLPMHFLELPAPSTPDLPDQLIITLF